MGRLLWNGDVDYLVFRAAEDEDERVSQESHKHGGDKTDGYELLLARHGEKIFLGVFNWSDEKKTYRLSGKAANRRWSPVIP